MWLNVLLYDAFSKSYKRRAKSLFLLKTSLSLQKLSSTGGEKGSYDTTKDFYFLTAGSMLRFFQARFLKWSAEHQKSSGHAFQKANQGI